MIYHSKEIYRFSLGEFQESEIPGFVEKINCHLKLDTPTCIILGSHNHVVEKITSFLTSFS